MGKNVDQEVIQLLLKAGWNRVVWVYVTASHCKYFLILLLTECSYWQGVCCAKFIVICSFFVVLMLQKYQYSSEPSNSNTSLGYVNVSDHPFILHMDLKTFGRSYPSTRLLLLLLILILLLTECSYWQGVCCAKIIVICSFFVVLMLQKYQYSSEPSNSNTSLGYVNVSDHPFILHMHLKTFGRSYPSTR